MGLREKVLAVAASRGGMKYRLNPPPDGVTTIDCSLYGLKTLEDAGIPLPQGVRTAEQMRQAMRPIGWQEVLPGDFIFFEGTYDAAGPAGFDGKIASHVGISLGRGTLKMWDAHERPDGTGVGVTVLSDWWQERLFEARRPPGLEAEFAASTGVLHGIDVSEYQGVIDWRAVRATGIEFAIIRAGQRANRVDKRFGVNWLEANRAGLIRGAYWFAEPATDPLAATEVLAFRQAMGQLSPNDMIALDLEEWNGVLSEYQGSVAEWALTWLRGAESTFGVRPFIYTNAGVAEKYSFAAYPELAKYPLWLADWTPPYPVPLPWARYTILQTGAAGQVLGVQGDVDTDEFEGQLSDLRKYGFSGTSQQLPSAPLPATVSPSAKYHEDGRVGSGILEQMALDGTTPAGNSTFYPLGLSSAELEECYGKNGTKYVWHLKLNVCWRYSKTS